MQKSLLILLFFLVSCASPTAPNTELLLVSTTSTQDSGLLDVLLPVFEEQAGYHVKLVAVGSGQALNMGEQGNADVILLHSPQAEREFMAKGFGLTRQLVMYNDFVIVGPASDPAGVGASNSAAEAFGAISASSQTFVSRSDDSGTHIKELSVWDQAGENPNGKSWYLETGQGQGITLVIASERQAYALTDRATYLAYQQNIDLQILLEGDPVLLNVYHVIIVNPEKWPHVNLEGAQAFANFITSPAGQEIIRQFGVEQFGQSLFVPAADKMDADLGLDHPQP